MSITIRIFKDDKDVLDTLCEKLNMDKKVILGYLLEQAVKHEMFDPQWIEKLTEITFHDLLMEADLDYRRGFEIAKYKATLGLRASLVKELIKAMPPEERVDYLKNTLGDPKSGVDLLEDMAQHQMFTVNGEKKMYPPGQDGRPRITGIAPSQFIKCPRGFHLLNDPCVGCDIHRTCPIVHDERVNWLAIHGTLEEREAFISKSSVRRIN